MKVLWAPWRMKYVEYVSVEKPKGCFLCDAVKAKDFEEKMIVYRDKLAIAVMNLFPYNTGHLLVAPCRHVPSLENLTDEEMLALWRAVVTCMKALRLALKPHGFNVGVNIGRVAGAGLEGHVHVHIVPRWEGDTNFMPVVASTKVIPEGVMDTYKKIIEAGREILVRR